MSQETLKDWDQMFCFLKYVGIFGPEEKVSQEASGSDMKSDDYALLLSEHDSTEKWSEPILVADTRIQI